MSIYEYQYLQINIYKYFSKKISRTLFLNTENDRLTFNTFDNTVINYCEGRNILLKTNSVLID